jgi:hypothetical protein
MFMPMPVSMMPPAMRRPGDRDAEEIHEEGAADQEAHQDADHVEAAFQGLARAPLLAVAVGDGEKGRAGRERVDDRQKADECAEENSPEMRDVGHRVKSFLFSYPFSFSRHNHRFEKD